MVGKYLICTNHLYNSFKGIIWATNELNWMLSQLSQFIPKFIIPTNNSFVSQNREAPSGFTVLVQGWPCTCGVRRGFIWRLSFKTFFYGNIDFFDSIITPVALLMVAVSVQGTCFLHHQSLSSLAASQWARPRSWSTRNTTFLCT